MYKIGQSQKIDHHTEYFHLRWIKIKTSLRSLRDHKWHMFKKKLNAGQVNGHKVKQNDQYPEKNTLSIYWHYLKHSPQDNLPSKSLHCDGTDGQACVQ